MRHTQRIDAISDVIICQLAGQVPRSAHGYMLPQKKHCTTMKNTTRKRPGTR